MLVGEKNKERRLGASEKGGRRMFEKLKGERLPDFELFVYFDSKSKSYTRPMVSKNKEVFLRDLINMFRDPATAKDVVVVNAEDFSAYRVATYSVQTGKLDPVNLEHVANLNDIRAMAAPSGGPGALSPT